MIARRVLYLVFVLLVFGPAGCIDKWSPSVPTGLSATATDGCEVELSWDASMETGWSGLTGYDVYRDGDFLMQVLEPFHAISDTGLDPHTSYSYQVAAFDGSGNCSEKSEAEIVMTAACNTDPVSLMSSLEGFGYIYDLAVDQTQGVAIVSHDSAGLSLVDIQDPSSPFVYAEFPGSFYSVAIGDSVAYAIDFRLSPREMVLVTIELGEGSPSIASEVSLSGQYSNYRNGLALHGDLLYVASTEARLHIFDVSNPLFPDLLTIADIQGWPKAVAADGEYAYVGSAGSLTVLDTRNPEDPVVISENGPMCVEAIAVEQDRLYWFNQGSNIMSADASDWSNLWFHNQLQTQEMDVGIGHLVGAWPDQIKVFDLTDPINPQLIQEIETPFVQALAIDGDVLMTGDEEGTLRVYALR